MSADTNSDRRRERAGSTRNLLLSTAERLYAERGLAAVSMRQIIEAAGVANNSALTYHIGTRTDLIRAIVERHERGIARHARAMLEETRGSTDPREHVACLVLPYVRHLAELGTPSWWARFTAQISSDPAHAGPLHAQTELATLVEEAGALVWAHAPNLPAADVALRTRMIRHAVLLTCAEQEAAEQEAAEQGAKAEPGWARVGAALTDAVTGIVLAEAHRSGG